MSSKGALVIRFIGDTRDFDGAMKNVQSSTRGGASGISRVGGAFKSVAKMGALAAVAAGGVAVKLGIDAVGAASDLNETISKSKVIFGKYADDMIALADRSATMWGLSKNEALGAMTSFADMFDQIGYGKREAAGLSQQVVTLATDLGSFNNLETADVMDRLSSAFRGEFDSLQALIPNINAARVQTQALAMTGKKNAANLTAQEKAAATLAIVTKDGAKAQGDFARTSGGLANQQKILKAQLKNVQAEIGQKLLPVAVKLMTFFNDKGLPAIRAFGGYLEKKVPPIMEKVRAAFDKAREFIARFSGDGSSKVGKFVNDVVRIFNDGVSIVKSLWNAFGGNIVGMLRSTFSNLFQIVKGGFQIIQGVFKTVSALLKGDWGKAWEGIKLIVKGAWNVISGFVKQGWNIVKFAFKNAGVVIRALSAKLWSGIKALTAKAWVALQGLARKGWDKVIDFFKKAPGRIRGLIGNYVSTGRDLMGRMFEVIKDKAGDGARWLVDKIREIPGKVKDLAGKFREAGAALIGAVANGIKNAAGFATDFAGQIWTAVKGAINDGIDQLNDKLEFSFKVKGVGISVNAPDIGHLAKGTNNWRGGLSMVGEKGPELVDLPRGSKVFTAAQTRRMVSAPAMAPTATGGGSGDVHVHFHGPVAGNPQNYAREIRKELLKLKRELNTPLGLA